MVIVATCLLAAAFATVNGFHHNPTDGETAIFGYRYEDDGSLVHKRDSGKNVMWIGPRLGRRKRSEEDNNLNLPDKNGEAVMEFLQDTPWAIVALKGTKRRTVNFIPRLGRDSEEEFVDGAVNPSFLKSSSRSGNQVVRPYGGSGGGGSNNFTPRLGRFATFYNRDHL